MAGYRRARPWVRVMVLIVVLCTVGAWRLASAGGLMSLCRNEAVSIAGGAPGAASARQAFETWRAGDALGTPSRGWRITTDPATVLMRRGTWVVTIDKFSNGWFVTSSNCRATS